MVRKTKKTPFPSKISPMLATLTNKPFNNPDWLYEVKWDGYRILAHVRKGNVVLRSKEAQDYTSKYLLVAEALQLVENNAVIDGEVVVLNEEGKADFSLLQNYKGQYTIQFYVFDLLWLDGFDLMHLPLTERKSKLLEILPADNDVVKFSADFENGLELFEEIKKMNWEGIIAKQKESIYVPGKRSKDWLKIKISNRREFVIGGWAESENTRSFRSILFGEYVDRQLRYVHHSGGGYTRKEKADLFQTFKKLEIKTCPFVNPEDVVIETKIHWVKPVLVAEFEISNTTTKTGIIRHPAIFKGLRNDKKPADAVPELAQEQRYKGSIEIRGSWAQVSSRTITSEETITIEGKKINLVNIERHVWKDVTKADLIQYYISISDYILPYLKDRPLGINVSLYDPKESFFLRGMEGYQPKWAKIFTTDRKHKKAEKSDKIEWLVCNNLATLVWIINLDCIDLHPWASRTVSPKTPDYISIDLDPSDNDFSKVVETAQAAKALFDRFKLASFVKTSGKTGMHLYIPSKSIQYGDSRTIAENLCQAIHELVPSLTTNSASVNSRGNKLYVDPSQNDYADRLVGPYCVRAFHLPTVSTPLEWKEVNAKLRPESFDIHTIPDRLKKKGDLLATLLDQKKAAKNSQILRRLL